MTLTTRRILSVVIAVVTAAVGGPLLWVGGAGAYIASQRLQMDAGSVAVAIGGIILLVVSLATVLISALGVTVVGVLHGLVGIVALIVPFDPAHGIQSPVWIAVNAVASPGSPFSVGFTIFVVSGAGLLIGTVYAMAGQSRIARTVGRGPDRSTLGIALGAPLMLLGGALTVFFGGMVYRASFVFQRPEVAALLFMLLGVFFFALGFLIDARYTGWGEVIAGGLIIVVGLVAFVAPDVAFRAVGQTWTPSLSLVGPTLFLVALGVVLVASAVIVRRTRAPAASTVSNQVDTADFS